MRIKYFIKIKHPKFTGAHDKVKICLKLFEYHSIVLLLGIKHKIDFSEC